MTMTNVENFFGETGPLAKKFKGYEKREEQVVFSKAIEEAISRSLPMLGEAPTGVGKSLAALAPAFESIKQGNVVLVVTSSILLQEQYFYKDVPLMEELYGIKVSPVLIKGKGNYLCLHKAANQQLVSTTDEDVKVFDQLTNWARQTKTGDKSELPFEPQLKHWSKFSVTEESECAGKQCPMFKQCHYYRERSKMSTAKLIICNYHYLFTAFKNSALLPGNIKVVIMDEGHEASAIARDMTLISYNQNTYRLMNEKLINAQKQMAHSVVAASIHDETGIIEMLDTHQKLMLELAQHFYKFKTKDEKWKLEKEDLDYLQVISANHIKALSHTISCFEDWINETGLRQEMRENWDSYYTEEEINFQLAVESYYESLLARQYNALLLFGHIGVLPEEEVYGDEIERIIWIEPHGENTVAIKSCATKAAPITGELFKKEPEFILGEATPIFISATLTTAGSFDHIAKDLGFPEDSSKRVEKMVDSPFDLTNNMLWYLPNNIPPGNSREHSNVCIEEMFKIIKLFDGRTMCLFTSIGAMNYAARKFRDWLPSHISVMVQGKHTKTQIIKAIKDSPHTVIVATRSFFTGVDIQGQNLSAVLIDKLPYPMIGDPINDYLMNKDRGFYDFTLPETIITLKQGFGRLNRTASDRGVVSVLDGRLATAGYKNFIFNSYRHRLWASRDFEDVKKLAEVILNDSANQPSSNE